MRRISGFPNYLITKSGRVWSCKRAKSTGGWVKPRIGNTGYLGVRLYKDKKYHLFHIHRLVLETFVGPRPKGMEARHLNGDPLDNHLKNLQWGTRSENQQDAIRHGTFYMAGRYGEKVSTSKLSDRDRRTIIYQFTTGLFTLIQLAKEYNVGISTIHRVVTGKQWPFVDARKLRRIACA